MRCEAKLFDNKNLLENSPYHSWVAALGGDSLGRTWSEGIDLDSSRYVTYTWDDETLLLMVVFWWPIGCCQGRFES